jgi:flavodoxin
LEVHQGVGSLILGNPPHDEEDFPTAIYPLNPTVTPSVTVPPNHFYTLEAASWSQEPLVVSEMFEIKGEGELRNAEIVVSPGQKTITTPDGPIDVPEEFREGIFT